MNKRILYTPILSDNLQSALAAGVIDHWSFEEAGTGNRTGEKGNVLTATGTISATTGKVGSCVDLERANTEYFSRTHDGTFSTGDISFSVSFWALLRTGWGASNGYAVIKGGTAGGIDTEYAIMVNTSNKARFFAYDTTSTVAWDFTSTATLSENTWYHIVATHNSVTNVASLYVNNGTPDTATSVPPPHTRTSGLQIGRINSGAYWDGSIDELTFFNYALSAADVATLYNGGSGLAYSNF